MKKTRQECPHCGHEQEPARMVCEPPKQGGCGLRMHGQAEVIPLDTRKLSADAALAALGAGSDDHVRSAHSG